MWLIMPRADLRASHLVHYFCIVLGFVFAPYPSFFFGFEIAPLELAM